MAGKPKFQGRPLTPDDGDRVVLEDFVYSPLNQLTRLLAREYVMEFSHRGIFRLCTKRLRASQTFRRFAYFQAYFLMKRHTLSEPVTK
jgi:hypothetical protein